MIKSGQFHSTVAVIESEEVSDELVCQVAIFRGCHKVAFNARDSGFAQRYAILQGHKQILYILTFKIVTSTFSP
jgi:hypothetical protein